MLFFWVEFNITKNSTSHSINPKLIYKFKAITNKHQQVVFLKLQADFKVQTKKWTRRRARGKKPKRKEKEGLQEDLILPGWKCMY